MSAHVNGRDGGLTPQSLLGVTATASVGLRHVAVASDLERPVFVLTVARSGSTLLRFILDSHPDLACPPETAISVACGSLARAWEILSPSGGSVSPDVAAVIRKATDDVYAPYLRQRGRRRWCDKSLHNIQHAELLAQIYPGAQFICLYRHCLDVVVSAVEAAPWGINGYGLDKFIADTPGNSVLAVARGWLVKTRAIAAFQAAHRGRCYGLRYEDLVTSPAGIVEELLRFLRVRPAPGLTDECFAAAHERGPGDHKVWFTSGIESTSLGQGVRVPVWMIPPELTEVLNQTLEGLSYRPIDARWQEADGPVDPRADAVLSRRTDPGTAGDDDPEFLAAVREIAARITSATGMAGGGSHAGVAPGDLSLRFAIVVAPCAATASATRWEVRYEDSAFISVPASQAADACAAFIADAGTWLKVLGGQANPAAEMSAGRLRFSQVADSARAHEPGDIPAEVLALSRLLGTTSPTEGDSDHASQPVETSRDRHLRERGHASVRARGRASGSVASKPRG